jgi:hypothetical protein
MRRSRSSFDLSDAIHSAESLSPKPAPASEPRNDFGGVPLVNFDRKSVIPEKPSPREALAMTERHPGRLAAPPSLEGFTTVGARCNRLLEWLRSDPHTTSVLLVDAEGLPIAQESANDEALLGATAGVAHAIRQLALASPGSVSREFESHVGDGPILSLLGFMVGTNLYVVGLSHTAPLAEQDTARIRAAFTSALAELSAPVDRHRAGGT